MFNKKSNAVEMSLDKTHSLLSQTVKIIGEINSKDDLRIDGDIEGNICCDGKVIIGPNGNVVGNIKSASIELMGKITGDVTVYDILRLKAASSLKGEITAANIEIEAGANFFGNCKMLEKENVKLNKELLEVD